MHMSRVQGQLWQQALPKQTLLPEAQVVEVGLEQGGNFDFFFFLARH